MPDATKPQQLPLEKFFVSYNKADKSWAEWISWQLEEGGYTAFLQAWDIKPGTNFVFAMQQATAEADRTVAVLSPDYIAAQFTQPEWTAAFVQDPTGVKGLLVPVRVREVDLRGMWTSIVYIDLVGLSKEQAKQALLNSISRKRGKPDLEPTFPVSEQIELGDVKNNHQAPEPKTDINFSEEPRFPVTSTIEDPFTEWTVIDILKRTDDTLAFLFRKEGTREVKLDESEQPFQPQLIANLVNNIRPTSQTNHAWVAARQLLIPQAITEQLADINRLYFIVDKASAQYPWELIVNASNSHSFVPLAIKATMLRAISAKECRVRGTGKSTSNTLHALVIGDPNLQGAFPQLPAAYHEALTVATIMEQKNFKVTSLINIESSEIIVSLFSNLYKIMHFSGSGVYDEKKPEKCGLQIGANIFLTVQEFTQMAYLPELLFINFGYAMMDNKDFGSANYGKLAANLGTSLIELGVKAVVISGYAIEDQSGIAFSEALYESMLSKQSFAEAVQSARHAAWKTNPEGSTWGAFQCYGAPDFNLFDIEDQHKEKQIE